MRIFLTQKSQKDQLIFSDNWLGFLLEKFVSRSLVNFSKSVFIYVIIILKMNEKSLQFVGDIQEVS